MTPPYDVTEIKQLLARMQHWEDDAMSHEGTCVRCHEACGKEPEHEQSPLCNACAQDLATRVFPRLEAVQQALDLHREKLVAEVRAEIQRRRIAPRCNSCGGLIMHRSEHWLTIFYHLENTP
jgi:formylmethanofuran dehydrogenase subunit E